MREALLGLRYKKIPVAVLLLLRQRASVMIGETA